MMRSGRGLLLPMIFVLAVAPSAVAAASTPAMPGSSDPLVVLSGNVVVSKDMHVGEIVVFHGSVRVDGMAHRDVVCMDGPVTITGLVLGSVVSLNGPVTVAPGAHVYGDVVSRSHPVISPDAKVDGKVQEISGTLHVSLRWLGFFAWWIPVTFSTLALGTLLLWLFPGAASRIAAVARTNPAAAGGWGFLAVVGLPVLAVLAMVTLIGMPLGLGLLFALGLVYGTAYTCGMFVLGRWILPEPRGRLVAFLLGWVILRALALIPWGGGLFTFLAAVFGIGVVVVAAYRTRGPSPLAEAIPPAP